MDYQEYTILGKKPGSKVAFVACQHGDEPIGKLVIDKLLKEKIEQGSMSLIIANPKALAKNKRYLEKDLNRSYPGKQNGKLEERIAFALYKRLKDFDYVFDIHAAKVDCGNLIIVTELNNKKREMISLLPIKKILHITDKVYGKSSLISYCNGIGLEYGGSDKSGKNYKQALKHARIILKNLGMISGRRLIYTYNREIYIAKKKYIFKKPIDEIYDGLAEFSFIKKGAQIGKHKGKPVFSEHSFFPIFIQKVKNTKNFALMTTKSSFSVRK